jgi:anti-sigma B factor antagonist
MTSGRQEVGVQLPSMLTKAMFMGQSSTPAARAVFSVADGHAVTSLRWTGEIDVTQVPELRDEILALPSDRSVHLDLSTVSYLDSSGLGMLVLLRKRLARRGAEVTLFDVQPHVRRVLEITGLNRAFQFASASEPADADEIHVAETQPE